jgi:hypothetical protein
MVIAQRFARSVIAFSAANPLKKHVRMMHGFSLGDGANRAF